MSGVDLVLAFLSGVVMGVVAPTGRANVLGAGKRPIVGQPNAAPAGDSRYGLFGTQAHTRHSARTSRTGTGASGLHQRGVPIGRLDRRAGPWRVFGDVSDELRQLVAPFGAEIVGHWSGFTR